MSTLIFARLLDARLQVVQQLHDISRRQQQAIESRDMATLMSLLSAKQQILTVLGRLDQQLMPYSAEDPDQRQWDTPHERERCRQQAARGEALLREILTMEKQAENDMIAQRDEAAAEIAGFRQQARAEQAYSIASEIAPRSRDMSLEG